MACMYAFTYHTDLLRAKCMLRRNNSILSFTTAGALVDAGFDVNKVGDARVGLVGFPSVGKSTLLTKLTGTMSEVRLLQDYGTSGMTFLKAESCCMPLLSLHLQDCDSSGMTLLKTERCCMPMLSLHLQDYGSSGMALLKAGSCCFPLL